MNAATNKRNSHNSIQSCNDKFILLYLDVLQTNNLFRNVETSVIETLLTKIRHQIWTYQKGNIIAFRGEVCDSLRIILKGSVVGEIIDSQGKSLHVETLTPPNSISPAFLFGSHNLMPVSVSAMEKTIILQIFKHDFLILLRENEMILKNYLDMISDRVYLLTQKIEMLGLQSIRGKFAQYLLKSAEQENQMEFMIKHTQSELANMFGVSRPALARVIREMHNEGVLTAKGRKITITDKQLLQKMIK